MKYEILRNGNVRISIPVTFKTQSGRKRIAAKDTADLPECESPMLLNLARGFHWQELIDEGTYPNIKALADAIGIDSGVVAKAIRLTLLSPKIIHKLIVGEANLSLQTMRRAIPMVWETQEKELLK